MQKLLYSFKNKPYLSDLKNLLGELFYESIIQNETFTKELKRKNWVFVPVSLSKEKLRKRGYNQSEILAKYLGEKLKIQVEKKEFLGKNVFLIDDLIVRGETVGDAAKALKKAGAKRVIALVLVGK